MDTVICRTCAKRQPAPSAYGLDHGYCNFCGTSFGGGANLRTDGPSHNTSSHDWRCARCGYCNRYRDMFCENCNAPAPFANPTF
jgi:hypothetical protein